ncbi:MAG: site-2 protease family protein [Dehalococcoidia bacterium]
MGNSITLLRIFGIPFRINYTWLVIFGLVLTILAVYQFPSSNPEWSAVEYWLIAAVTTVLFFVSVVLHELSHALLALRHGIPVKSITLFIFGGVAHIAREAERPRTEAVIALAGPISSLILAGGFLLLHYFVGSLNEEVGAIASWLAIINASLAIFNMLPGFPLDGGRVLRAVIWSVRGDYRKATRVSTWVGRGVAYLMIMGGAALVFTGHWANGIWLMFIGLFLDTAAVANYRQTMLREALRQHEIGELMAPLPAAIVPVEGAAAVEATENASRVMEDMEEKGLQEALVVRGGVVVGIVSRDALRRWRGT